LIVEKFVDVVCYQTKGEGEKMPNGRGTAQCIGCKYVSWEASEGMPADIICTFWNVLLPIGGKCDDSLEYLLPPEEYEYDNLVCKDYTPNEAEDVFSSDPIFSRIEKGLLYAVCCNEISNSTAYHRVVCRLSKSTENDPESEKTKDKYWLEESTEDYIGKCLLVANVFSNVECGSFIRNSLFKLFTANFRREDPGASFFAIGKKLGKTPFHIRLLQLWDYQGKRYGGIAKIEERKLWCNNFWVVFSIYSAGNYNFTDQIGKFTVHIGPEEPVFWNGIWPRFESGSPRFSGLVEIKA
jgi:hypothetical protein